MNAAQNNFGEIELSPQFILRLSKTLSANWTEGDLNLTAANALRGRVSQIAIAAMSGLIPTMFMSRVNELCLLRSGCERASQTVFESLCELPEVHRQSPAPIRIFVHRAGNVHLIRDAKNILECDGEQARW